MASSHLRLGELNFNPRSREGSDNISFGLPYPSNNISIHAPAKGATLKVFQIHVTIQFQSTLPRRERRISFGILVFNFKYFNPRSREGSDCMGSGTTGVACKFQSTLPRRERRAIACVSILQAVISIHAPAKGATGLSILKSTSVSHFNPRSREGSDFLHPLYSHFLSISIHAPAKGATALQLHTYNIL